VAEPPAEEPLGLVGESQPLWHSVSQKSEVVPQKLSCQHALDGFQTINLPKLRAADIERALGPVDGGILATFCLRITIRNATVAAVVRTKSTIAAWWAACRDAWWSGKTGPVTSRQHRTWSWCSQQECYTGKGLPNVSHVERWRV